MGVAWDAIFVLIAIVVSGPLYYSIEWLITGVNKGSSSNKDENEKKTTNGEGVRTIATDAMGGGAVAEKEDDRSDRGKLTEAQFVFGLIGYAIGIGNVWRFPYVISQNGGAAAVVAYIICGALVAVPLFLYEMIVGQYTRLSTMRCYEMIRPRWKSFGWGQAGMLIIGLAYYNVIIAYTLPYIVSSCMNPLPWVEEGPHKFWFQTILNECPGGGATRRDDALISSAVHSNECAFMGALQWKLVISLLVVWMMCYGAVCFGRDVLAKVTYVAVLIPVGLIFILVARTAFLEGASDGIQFYIGKFEASQLLRLEVWAAACGQILFSLSPGFGTAITYSSYVSPKEDVYKVCMIVAVSNSCFSLVAGLATFSMVGNLAYQNGLSVEQVATSSGTGLVFITVAESMQFFGKAQNIMSVLFFVMLLCLGLDSSFAWIETVVAYVEDFMDQHGWNPRPPIYKTTLFVCVALFLLGLPFCTRLGNSVLDVVDHYVTTLFFLVVCFLESIMFRFDFTWERMVLAIKEATTRNKHDFTDHGRTIAPTFLCKFDFLYSIPILTSGLAVYLFFHDFVKGYKGYSIQLQAFGWTLFSLLMAITAITLPNRDKGQLPALTNSDEESDADIQEQLHSPPTITTTSNTNNYNKNMTEEVDIPADGEVI